MRGIGREKRPLAASTRLSVPGFPKREAVQRTGADVKRRGEVKLAAESCQLRREGLLRKGTNRQNKA